MQALGFFLGEIYLENEDFLQEREDIIELNLFLFSLVSISTIFICKFVSLNQAES